MKDDQPAYREVQGLTKTSQASGVHLVLAVALAMELVVALMACAQDPGSTADEAVAPAETDAVQTMFPHPSEGKYWVSGQANFIFQTHPPFFALYSGTNSLQPYYEKATSRVLTPYTGYQITKSIEVLLDVEEAGGQGLSQALGLAGSRISTWCGTRP